MRTRNLYSVGCLGILALLSLASTVQGQAPSLDEEQALEYLLRVKLEVRGSDSLVNRTTSFITRELRELQGVTVVESDAYWVIEVIVDEIESVSGQVDGVVMSYVILHQPAKPYTALVVGAVLNKEFTEREKGRLDAVDNLRGNSREFDGHGLFSGAPKDLREICERLVVDFDVRNLEPARKGWQEAEQFIRNR